MLKATYYKLVPKGLNHGDHGGAKTPLLPGRCSHEVACGQRRRGAEGIEQLG
jgi:hypothetical protein